MLKFYCKYNVSYLIYISNSIHNKLPFENDNQDKHQEYYDELKIFIDKFSDQPLSEFDQNIIKELADEVVPPIQETFVCNNSAIGNMGADQKFNKW